MNIKCNNYKELILKQRYVENISLFKQENELNVIKYKYVWQIRFFQDKIQVHTMYWNKRWPLKQNFVDK